MGKWTFLMFVGAVTQLCSLLTALPSDKNPNCERWAKAGECNTNPSRMWTDCVASCDRLAVNDNPKCGRWSDEGECTNNPRFIQAHCPESCSKGLSWSPWARKALKMGELTGMELTVASCPEPMDVMGAAVTMRERLQLYLNGGHSAVIGLSSSSPNEYLGMLGLSEAFLYTLRLYGVVIKDSPTATQLDDEQHNGRIAVVSETLALGYSSDIIARRIPSWISLLEESEEHIRRLLPMLMPPPGKNGVQQCPASEGPRFSAIIGRYTKEDIVWVNTPEEPEEPAEIRIFDTPQASPDDPATPSTEGTPAAEGKDPEASGEQEEVTLDSSGETVSDGGEKGPVGDVTRPHLDAAEVDAVMKEQIERLQRAQDEREAIEQERIAAIEEEMARRRAAGELPDQQVEDDDDDEDIEDIVAEMKEESVADEKEVGPSAEELAQQEEVARVHLEQHRQEELRRLEEQQKAFQQEYLQHQQELLRKQQEQYQQEPQQQQQNQQHQQPPNQGQQYHTPPPPPPRGPTVVLVNGLSMPMVGYGTWPLKGYSCYGAVMDAVKAGYRHFDTAQAYGNERNIGQALSQALTDRVVTREQLFITTKLSDEESAGYAGVMELVKQQMAALQVNYLDLYMLHKPLHPNVQAESWAAIEDLYYQGIVRSIGVSNFDGKSLRTLLSHARIAPMVIQNKFDIYHHGKQIDGEGDDIVAFSKSIGALMIAYSSFSSFPFVLQPLDDPVVRYIASQRRNPTTAAQVLLRWTLQQGHAVIPRATNKQHMIENLAAAKLYPPLSEDEMSLLNSVQHFVASPVSVVV